MLTRVQNDQSCVTLLQRPGDGGVCCGLAGNAWAEVTGVGFAAAQRGEKERVTDFVQVLLVQEHFEVGRGLACWR